MEFRPELVRTTPAEEQFQRQVIDLAHLHGWLVAHFRPAMTRGGKWVTAVAGDGAGFPDLVLVRERVLFVELKVGKNTLDDNQRHWRNKLAAARAEWHLWRPEYWSEIEKALAPLPAVPAFNSPGAT